MPSRVIEIRKNTYKQNDQPAPVYNQLQNSPFAQKILSRVLNTQNLAVFTVATDNYSFESSSKYFVQDLIGEGPIAGLVDPNGNELVLFDEGKNNTEILKGIYLNDYPIKNNLTNSFNYNRLQIYSRSGTEFQSYLPLGGIDNFSFANPGIVYSFEKTLYGIEKALVPSFIAGKQHVSSISIVENGQLVGDANLKTAIDFKTFFSAKNFEECFGAYHEVKDPNTDYLFLNLKINSLYVTGGDGSTGGNSAVFGIEIGYKLTDRYKAYVIHYVYGAATSPYLFDLFLDISDFDFSLQPYVKIYNLSEKQNALSFTNSRSIGVNSVTEVTALKYKYPNSCYFLSVFDGRGFSQPPNRSFDLKGLKIKVPENYDAESKIYNGFWSGEFDPVLRWTDNPAWILYDIITNYRYGLGKFAFQEGLADKWNLYKIAKYCDEMVPTNNISKFPTCKIKSINFNFVRVVSDYNLSEFFKVGNEIDLVNLKFTDEDEDGQPIETFKSCKAIIGAVHIDISGKEAVITLINNFGLHKIFSLFPSVKTYIQNYLSQNSITSNIYQISVQKLVSILSQESNLSTDANNSLFAFIEYMKTQYVFTDDERRNYITNTGVAAALYNGYLPLVEPRFRCNISISNETDVINLLNNISSIFKGMAYWSNNLVSFDNDRPKSPSYFFNNSNVKDGVFNYSGSSKDTRYTVAKVVYSDESDSYKDKTVYVEDQLNIRRYGYVEKEIIGFGITSKSQAKRIGEWFLITNQVEEELVSFTAGPEALLLSPGNVISVTDELKLAGRRGGRVVSIVDEIVILDDRYDFIKAGDILSFIIPTKSKTVQDLEKESLKNNTVSDSKINELQPTYIYKFEVFDTSLDGNFKTQITLKANTFEQRRNLLAIYPSALWVYDKDGANTSLSFSKQYRVVAIKERSQIEFDITAAEYQKTKFTYIENKQNLKVNSLYSPTTENINDFIPVNILTLADYTPPSDFYVVGSKTFNINDRYDYVIPAFDYDDSGYQNLISIVEIKNHAIFTHAVNNKNASCKGFVVEYTINSKKVSYVWRVGDKNSTFIAAPTTEMNLSFETLRVYMIKENDVFINPNI